MLRELLLDFLSIVDATIYFCDCDDDWYLSRFSMIDGFYGLFHDTIISCSDDHDDISDF